MEEKSMADELQKNFQTKIQIEKSPEKKFQELIPNKVPKFHSSSKDMDQAEEATIKKARVSVRARSEASIVSQIRIKKISSIILFNSIPKCILI